MAGAYFVLDRLGEAESILRRGSERKPGVSDIIIVQYQLAFLKGDPSEMERQVALARGKSGVEDIMSDEKAFVLAYSGRLQPARSLAQRGVDLAKQAGQRERAAAYE